jgi:hypothetical protein
MVSYPPGRECASIIHPKLCSFACVTAGMRLVLPGREVAFPYDVASRPQLI